MALMQAGGFNTLRTYDRPPGWLLDLAERHGVRVLAGLPWPQHVTVADTRAGRQQLMQSVGADVRARRGVTQRVHDEVAEHLA